MPAVPDLVFSEMKFLQKEQPSPEPNLQRNVPKKKRKKDTLHTKEGEISAYFTSKRAALAEKDAIAPSQRVRAGTDPTATSCGQGQRERRKSSDVVPTIETLDKDPYLGFGSGGPRHESASYVSWSESVRGPDLTPQLKQPSASQLEHHEVSKPHWMRHATENAQFARATQSAAHAGDLRSDSSAERFRQSSLVAHGDRVSRSHSFPRASSSPRKVNLIGRAAKVQPVRAVTSPTSIQPLAPCRASNERPSPETRVCATTHEQRTFHAAGDDILRQPNGTTKVARTLSDGEVHTSSDLENIIQHCNHSILERIWAVEQPEHYATRDARGDIDANNREAVPVAPLKARRRPTVRFAHIEAPSSNIVSTYTGPSFYERQAQEQRAALLDEEDLMDESCLAGQELVYNPEAQLHVGQSWEAQSDLMHDEGDITGESDVLEVDHVSDDRVRRLSSGDDVVARGFWRPNKLY